MNTQLKPVILETTIAVSAADLIASQEILEVVEWAKRHKQQLETAKKLYEDACTLVKAYMQSKEVLISPDGCRLATYKQQKDRVSLDTDLLKLNFAEEYELCLVTKPGNRPFSLE